MWLENLKVRVKQYPKGWVVETQKKTWYGKTYWVHIVATAGISNEPWHYSSKEGAVENASLYFKWDLLLSLQ